MMSLAILFLCLAGILLGSGLLFLAIAPSKVGRLIACVDVAIAWIFLVAAAGVAHR